MALSTLQSVSRDLAKGFDELRKENQGRRAKLVLLKESGEDVPYEVVTTVTKGWYAQFSERLGTTQFNVADMSVGFSAQVRTSDYLMIIDSDNPTLNNNLFEMGQDTNPAIGLDAYWKITGTSLNRLYILETEH